ncbi:ATP-binding protein [Roseovarius sp. C7]|uniref:PAS domain-containing sensor histidine kinase n=1 Tax=Roseovarius sp. C7 TaxID=3398643 RepID=UPI0039F67674
MLWSIYAAHWALIVGLLVLAFRRGGEAMRLREHLLKSQQAELAFREKAIDEHAMVLSTDAEGRILSVNKNFTTVLGFRETGLIGSNLRHFLGAMDSINYEVVIQRTNKGDVWSGDLEMLSAAGKPRILRTTAVPMFSDGLGHLKTMYFCTDVTKQRSSEQERQLTRCLQLLPEDVYLIDMETGEILFMNDSALRRLRWPEGVYRTLGTVNLPEPFGRSIRELCTEGLSSDAPESLQFMTECNGVPMEANVQIIETVDRQKRFVAVLRDISQRMEAETTRRNFMSMMTHELRTPLTSIKGAVQLLTAGTAGPLEPGVMSLLRIAENNGERLLRLVNDILDLNKLEAGKMEFNMGRVDLRAAITEAIEADGEYAAGLGVSFRCKTAETPLWVNGDKGRLLQVLTNLMSNAAKFSETGSRVDISAAVLGDVIRVSIQDRGPGIPHEARAGLFEPFKQAGATDKGRIKGTGLGLTIVKAIVEHHGGRVDFDTELGKGTTFYFDLPQFAETSKTGQSVLDHAA